MSFGGRTRPEAAIPVELRFIDLYMAALGALLFLSMLLAYLVPKLPAPVPQPDTIGARPKSMRVPLSIATSSLPRGVKGVLYNEAIAYRGGTGVISWSIVGGGSDLPPGVSFDESVGALRGIPGVARVSRIVIRAVDGTGAIVDRPLEIVFEPPPLKVERTARLLVTALSLFCLWLVVRSALATRGQRSMLSSLQSIRDSGEGFAYARGGHGVEIKIDFDKGGLRVYEILYQQQRTKTWFLLVALISLLAYVVYLWFFR